jgi:hypothetical protein
MQALIDGDVLRYEIGAVGQKLENGELVVRDWEFVSRLLDDKIREICRGAGSDDTDPIIFLTGDRTVFGDEYIPNFREAVAVGKAYKGTRKGEKPYHYRNITAYLLGAYDTRIANGCEADDLLGIEQYSRREQGDTIICTRDKDLRMVPGAHYGWECGKQPEFGPLIYDDIGKIDLIRRERASGAKNTPQPKIVGGGLAFFFAQLLTGDTVDNIGGLKRMGPVGAYELLNGCRTEEDYREAVQRVYREFAPDNYMELLEEQSKLLWIVRERDAEGRLKHYEW